MQLHCRLALQTIVTVENGRVQHVRLPEQAVQAKKTEHYCTYDSMFDSIQSFV